MFISPIKAHKVTYFFLISRTTRVKKRAKRKKYEEFCVPSRLKQKKVVTSQRNYNITNMEITGKIIAALEPREGTSKTSGQPWKLQPYVLETIEQRPRRCMFEVFGADRIAQMNLQVNQVYTISIDIDAHEYQGRWYNSIRAWQAMTPEQAAARMNQPYQQPGVYAQPGQPVAPAYVPPTQPAAPAYTAPQPAAPQPAAPAVAPQPAAPAPNESEDLPF